MGYKKKMYGGQWAIHARQREDNQQMTKTKITIPIDITKA